MKTKYRAWDSKLKLMCSFDDIFNYQIRLVCESEKLIFMMWSGFFDANGDEIYEGDILSLWYSRDTTGKDIVRFNHVVAWEDTNGFSGWNIPFLESASLKPCFAAFNAGWSTICDTPIL